MSIHKVYARKCQLRDLTKDKKLVKEFLNTNHHQGDVRGITLVYGLFHDSELVQIMCFGKPRFNRKYEWEIIRESSKKNVQVIGGASRLFSFFVKENNPLSVVVYTSKKDKHLYDYSDHYRKHMKFMRVRESYLVSVGIWESIEWPRNDSYGKSYSASVITNVGPDRVLGTKLGNTHGSNEDIMRSLGYEPKFQQEMSPTTDEWKAAGYLYKTECSCAKYYIGMSTDVYNKKVKEYLGSGKKWLNHINAYPDHFQTKTILKVYNDLNTLLADEVIEIEDNVNNSLCMNLKSWKQGERCPVCHSFSVHEKNCELKIRQGKIHCQECRTSSSRHKKECSLYHDTAKCSICLGRSGNHKKGCIHYSSQQNYCEECKGYTFRHKKDCSLFVEKEKCPECHMKTKHKQTCSFYTGELPDGFCKECGYINKHKKGCSQWYFCYECKSKGNKHIQGCSEYVQRKSCPECGGIGMKHKKNCSEYIERICIECGSSSSVHKRLCSEYKQPKECEECKSYLSSHKASCSHYKKKSCTECGGKQMRHRKNCSHYTALPECKICGGKSNNHKKDCKNHYKNRTE